MPNDKKDISLIKWFSGATGIQGEGSKIWDFKLYGDIIRNPNETDPNSENAYVELVYSDRFQPIQFVEKE
ncbi:hypothetical protein [Butyrivibrio sp. AE3004]|uniref:hypothetical protein n=1 Tax=Butyrivibrio sp. AE3004 TaxID=1506994 RepID=UPI0004941DC9|nr:hypothetical protein [Butyrivibrio sp. AE3004]